VSRLRDYLSHILEVIARTPKQKTGGHPKAAAGP
jgi:hypothetical protein